MSMIDATIDFGLPMRSLRIPLRHEFSGTVLRLRSDMDADELKRTLCEFIAAHRPQLAGGSVLAFNFNVCEQVWEVLYTHPSFDAVGMGDKLPIDDLYPCDPVVVETIEAKI